MRFRSKDRGKRVQDRARNGASKRAGLRVGKKGRKALSSSPLFHLLALVSFLARPNPRIPFLGLSLLRNKTETLATQASVIQTWLVEPFTELKSAEHMAKIIQHKSQIRVLKPVLKCIIRPSKIKYLQILKILFKNVIFLNIEYKMYLKILQKLRCLVAFQNRPSAPIGWDKNFVNFEFLE